MGHGRQKCGYSRCVTRPGHWSSITDVPHNCCWHRQWLRPPNFKPCDPGCYGGLCQCLDSYKWFNFIVIDLINGRISKKKSSDSIYPTLLHAVHVCVLFSSLSILYPKHWNTIRFFPDFVWVSSTLSWCNRSWIKIPWPFLKTHQKTRMNLLQTQASGRLTTDISWSIGRR